MDIGKLALQFSIANPDIHTNIVGTANPDRILLNIRESEEPLDEELLQGVMKILEPIHNRTWPSGRPEKKAMLKSRNFKPADQLTAEPRASYQYVGDFRSRLSILAND